MTEEPAQEKTQPTQPRRGEPVEIPLPTKREFLANLAKVAPPVAPADSANSSDDD